MSSATVPAAVVVALPASSPASNPPRAGDIAHDLLVLVDQLTTRNALAELGVLTLCLVLAWGVAAGLRRITGFEGAVLFGRRVVDGVLFPALALLFAWLARYVLSAMLPVAVFKLAIPILTSLAAIRLVVRVLSAAYPESGWMRAIERTVSWLAWLLVVLWITGVLPAVMNELDGVTWQIGGTTLSLRSMIEGSISAAVVMMLALWASAAIEKKIIRGTGDNLSMRKMIANIVRIVLLFLGLLVALSAAGIQLTALSVFGGAIGLGLGFGLQKITANYVSGFVVLAERSLRIGDMVKVDNFEGRITDIRTRYTVIRSLGGREAIVPNEMLITQRVENVTLADTRVLLQTSVGVAYGTDVPRVQAALIDALLQHARILKDPAPSVHLVTFGADGLDLQINFWIADPENGQGNVRSEVNLTVLRVFDALGVEIPYPQRVLRRAAPTPPREAGQGPMPVAASAAPAMRTTLHADEPDGEAGS
jgi:small-conductance mechanosensitive channel